MINTITYSLLVPCYNAEQFINQFLDNLAVLNKPFDEVIFYDDASTDGTYQLLISKGCNVIKGVENRGPGYARNKLVEHSSGKWFHFHDIDDGLDPDYLLKTSAIAESERVEVVLCNVNWFEAITKNLVISWEYSNDQIVSNPIAYTISNPVGGINGLYKKSKFNETSGFNTDIRIWEDADIHVKLAAENAQFFIIEEVLSYSLRYSGSASADQGAGWVTRLNLLQHYYEIFQEESNRKAIGIQAQIAAGNLILSGQFMFAKKAYQLSENCKVKVPYNNSLIWKYLKKFVPPVLRINLRLIQLKLAFGK